MLKACAKATVLILVAAMLSACSREKIDWKSAEAADTVESYDHFIERHPESELAAQARARVAQLNEDRDWKSASTTDTADAYRQFLAQHESGKWAGEARIRIENFALDGTATGPARPVAEAESTPSNGTSTAREATAANTAGSATTAGASPPRPGTFGPRADATPSAEESAERGAQKHSAAGKPATIAVAAPRSSAAAASASSTAAVSAKPSSPPATASHSTAAARPAVASAGAASSLPSQPVQFGIQLGAFHSQDAALANWKSLQTKYGEDLHGLFARAVPVQQSAGQLFRLQAPVGDESRARSICASLTRKSQPCVVVLPQAH